MYKVVVKFEKEYENENALIQNEVQVYTCEKFECVNDSMFGIALNKKEVVMIPIRRIHDIKVNTIEDGD